MIRPQPFSLLLPLLFLSACGSAKVTVEDAVVRLPIIAGRPGAAYFTLNGGDKADRLVAVETKAARRVELHEGGMSGGMMTMRRIDGVDVPAGGKAVFAPGGNHAMLFDISPDLKPGGKTTLTLRFASGVAATAEARVTATTAVGNSH
ncbi:copper chaperone PCu(A)C [Sphingomonas sp. ID0503]|uniref:copper chaperone PCu(A)C n=1 Tax=Sphingomonas sp. ID0503 TaxID=3399691 RepID=UPI003AFAF8BA